MQMTVCRLDVHFTSHQNNVQLFSQSFQYLKTTCCSLALSRICYRVIVMTHLIAYEGSCRCEFGE